MSAIAGASFGIAKSGVVGQHWFELRQRFRSFAIGKQIRSCFQHRRLRKLNLLDLCQGIPNLALHSGRTGDGRTLSHDIIPLPSNRLRSHTLSVFEQNSLRATLRSKQHGDQQQED